MVLVDIRFNAGGVVRDVEGPPHGSWRPLRASLPGKRARDQHDGKQAEGLRQWRFRVELLTIRASSS